MKLCFALLFVLSITACQAQSGSPQKPLSTPESQGFSSQRLARIEPVMQSYIDAGKLAGTLTLVARNGQVVFEKAQGMRDKEAGIPLSTDTIFRIYSMSKPITAVSSTSFCEQGKFHMFDPVAKYLPELAKMKVYVSGSGENMVLEDATNPIRIIDLFMHTSGFSYGFTNSEVDKLYQQLFAKPDELTRSNILAKLAALPLVHQPGSAWNYGVSIDILGFLVEKLSGQRLGDYLQTTVFAPLGMEDTGFYVPANKVNRFAKVYTADKTGSTVVMNNEPLGNFLIDPAIHNAGGGLVSTLHDYFVFAQMLLNGGEYQGKRILGRKTVEYMRANHMPDKMIPYSPTAQGEGYALGMSVTVDTDMLGFMGSKGNYGWGGMASTWFRIDPKENIIIIGMAQFIPIGFHRYQDDLRNLAYQALID